MFASTALPAPRFVISKRMPSYGAVTAKLYDSGFQRELGRHVDVEIDLGVLLDICDELEVKTRAIERAHRRELFDRDVATDELDARIALVPRRHALDVTALELPRAQLFAAPQIEARIAQHLAALRRPDLRCDREQEHERVFAH
jgi:hypothetical protein